MSESRFDVNDRVVITGIASGSKAHLGARGIVREVWPITFGYGVKLDGLDEPRWFHETDLEPETQSS